MQFVSVVIYRVSTSYYMRAEYTFSRTFYQNFGFTTSKIGVLYFTKASCRTLRKHLINEIKHPTQIKIAVKAKKRL